MLARMSDGESSGRPRSLLAAVPRRHLESALIVQRRRGCVALPALGVGDLGAAPPGADVYLYAYEEGGRPVPAATWRARLLRWAPAERDGAYPYDGDLVPPSLIQEMLVARELLASGPPASSPNATTGAEPDLAADPPPAGAYFEVEGLEELPKEAWLFTNELVPKRDRGARYFMPRAPVLAALPD